MFEVKLFQILQRDPLLLLPAPVEQTLHAALQTHSDVQPEGFASILISFNASQRHAPKLTLLQGFKKKKKVLY